jgi:hypothetical protein
MVFILWFILALCVTAASAATLSNNLVASKVTQLVTTTAPTYATCPTGYDCMTDADAVARFGNNYDTAPAGICGYKQSTTAVALMRIPQYCVKQKTTTVQTTCPGDCSCMLESAAKDKFQGFYKQCGTDPCSVVVTGAAQLKAYCFGPQTTTATPTCPEGYRCISNATVATQGGTWTWYSPDVCGYEKSTATLAAVVQVPKFCWMEQETTPVCPDGCTCLSDANAKLKGLTTKCDPSENPCGYQSSTATANIPANRVPLYCYKMEITTITTQPICGEGCSCIQEAEAKAKFGSGNYTRCDPNGQPCGYDPSAASANGIPKYCFRPSVTTTYVCPPGCTCTTNGTAGEKGLTFCGGKLISCGYNENKQPLYCFNGVSIPTCAYDYQKNACTGTCDQGYTCGLLASEKDATGKVVYAVCGCTGQTTTPCAYDAQKNACTGTCANQQSCVIVGRNVDEKTGATTPVCGCPQQSSCAYNYDKEACIGTCTVTGENCQLNTIYRDPTTGKVTYAECHCKGSGEETCAFNAEHYCAGTCPQGGQCANTSVVDAGGKMTFLCTCAGNSNCVLTADNECTGTCANQQSCARIVTRDDSGNQIVTCGCGGYQNGTPVGVATSRQGIFESIGSFFSRLLGGK